jgi:hypothetical protein
MGRDVRLRLTTPLPDQPLVRAWEEAPPNVRRAYTVMAMAWLRGRSGASRCGGSGASGPTR